MASKSKTKGSSYERDVSKFLSEKYGESFVRVPNSGAYIGGSNFHRAQHLSEGQVRSFKGDIIPPDNWKYFNCECKNYADFTFHHFFMDKHIPILEEWIDQCLDVSEDNDVNIMFIKITRKGQFVCYPEYMYQAGFTTTNYTIYESAKHGKWIFAAWDPFWQKNTDKIKDACVNGFDKNSFY